MRAALTAILLALVVGPSAGAAPGAIRPYHHPPWLVAPGRALTLGYALLDPSVTGTLYVRSDLRPGFTRLPLRPGPYCPGDPADAATVRREKLCGTALVARVPASLVNGSKLLYYAVLREGTTGPKTTVPAAGAAAPQRVWIVRNQIAVPLGAHRFGRLRAPDTVAARARVKVSCCADPPGGDGPSSFDVAADGSLWMLDKLNHRLLVWQHGRLQGRPARVVPLPRNLFLTDIAVGPGRTIYARTDDALYALTPQGRVRWRAAASAGIPTAPLQIGPNGVLYQAQACGGSCAPFGGGGWMPLTTARGGPVTAQRPNPLEPLAGGLRVVAEVSFSIARFALVDASDRVVRAWRVKSATRLGPIGGAPALINGDLVVPIEVSKGPRAERLILRLGSSGLRESFAVPAHPVLGETATFAALRIEPNGRVYQLRTTRNGTASIVAFAF
jgi:hypothetical protein